MKLKFMLYKYKEFNSLFFNILSHNKYKHTKFEHFLLDNNSSIRYCTISPSCREFLQSVLANKSDDRFWNWRDIMIQPWLYLELENNINNNITNNNNNN